MVPPFLLDWPSQEFKEAAQTADLIGMVILLAGGVLLLLAHGAPIGVSYEFAQLHWGVFTGLGVTALAIGACVSTLAWLIGLLGGE